MVSGLNTNDAPSIGDPGEIKAYADQMTGLVGQYILQMGQIAGNLGPLTIVPVFPPLPNAPPIGALPDPPTIDPITWTMPPVPNTTWGTLNIDAYLPAPFDGVAPTLNFGPMPAAFTDVAPTSPSINVDFAYPADLAITLPAPPSLLSISVSPFSGITMPTAPDSNIPTLNIVEPSVIHYIPGAQYTSGLLSQLQTSLLARIQGGSGLAPEVEQAIWDRGREREYRQLAADLAELERMEALGYAFPPGLYLNARIKVQTEFDERVVGHSREVMIKAAELEQENVKHALTNAIQLESQLISYANQIEQRTFEAAKYETQAAIEVYNAKVRAYTAYLDAYKTKVQIYTAQVDAEKAKVEAYKAQIEAEQAKAQVNTALVQQYKVQADVALSAITIYEAQIKAIQTKAEVEKLKVEVYGEQIKAYASKINAYTAQIEAYKASVGAEATKQEAFKAQVQAYAARVDAQAKVIDAKVAEYKGQIDALTAQWDGYKSAASAESSRVQALASYNNAVADLYKARVTGLATYNEVLTKQWQVAIDQAQRTTEIAVTTAKANAELAVTARNIAMDANKTAAQVCAQLGAAALNAINWSTSWGYQESVSQNSSVTTSIQG